MAQKMVPPGFKCELIYTVPDIEVPCVLTCDDEGSLYVGEDPMDMTGPPTKEIDRIVKIRWDKATGRPIKTVFAEHLSAVFGLIWHDGALVCHACAALHDAQGYPRHGRRGRAQVFGRRLRVPAGVYGFNDHIVSSIQLGMDGLVYVSCGDKGIPKAIGADGSTLTLEGGGVVRMRLDGTQLENFSSGTRNHLGLSLDWLDNIFTYDNTDDGLGWWTRFTHHIETGYYGYPYDYHAHPERPFAADRRIWRRRRSARPATAKRLGRKSFAATPFIANGAKERCSGLYSSGTGPRSMSRWTILSSTTARAISVLSMFVSRPTARPCTWPIGTSGLGSNPKRVGRLYRITYIGGDVPPEPPRASDADPLEAQLKSLDHPAHSERMRAQWRLAAWPTSGKGGVRSFVAGRKFAKDEGPCDLDREPVDRPP